MSAAVEAGNGAAPPACLPAGPAAPPRGFRLPPGAWDAHAHVIGGDAAHPFVAGRSYTPPSVNADDYVAMLDTVGLAHGVLIQISVHGTDNRLILDALRRHPTRLRGVVSIDGDESDAELGELKAAGVCGVRLNELYAGGSGTERLRRIAERCRELGWHLDLALHGPRLNALAPVLRTLGLPLVIDHMGWCATADGVEHPDFQAVLSLVGDADCWVKLSGVYRLSALAPPYPDAAPLVRALLKAAPRRCIWGSDWPHVALNDPARMPQPGDLLDALAGHVGDDHLLQAVLVDNPLRLFGQPGTPVNG